MAGTVTMTSEKLPTTGGVKKFIFSWTSDAAGNVSGTSFTLPRGTIIAAGFAPGTGAAQPTDLYDATLMCERHNADLLNGEGANLSNSVGNHRGVFIQTIDKSAFARQWCHSGAYQLVISNAGNAKSGTLDLYMTSSLL